MAKLLSTANWPEDGKQYPEYPVEFQLNIDPASKNADKGPTSWIDCAFVLMVRRTITSEKEVLFESHGQMIRRDLSRLAADIKDMIQQQQSTTMTFVPVAPSFELWLQHLSDEQYRAIVWQDLASEFGGASDIAYQGLRFTTNRTRLMGFARALESEIEA
jgi:hypothetical protein